jgi:ankyrin repeat protein
MDDSLKNSFSPQTPSQQQINDFVAAAGKGDAITVTAFIRQYKIFIDLRDESGNTALTWAVGQVQKEMVKLLLAEGADVEATDKTSWPALTHAAWHGQNETVELLLEKGAAIDARDKNGRTPLMCATRLGRTDTARLLLEKGAVLDEIAFDGETALMIARRSSLETAVLFEQWPELQRQREEEKRDLAERQAEELAENKAQEQAKSQLEKLKSRRPQSPFKKTK